MDTATVDLYFQKFDESIYDEGKIITWHSIANNLKLPINQIPELFSNYLSDRRQLKPNDFGVTYCICGILKEHQKLDICCIDEEHLNEKREKFEKIIKEQVYSIQKTKSIDFNAISLVDQIETNQDSNLSGSIVSKNCIKRIIKKTTLPSVQTKPTSSLFENVPKQSEKNQEQSSASSQNKTQPATLKRRNNGGIANFFTKAPVKPNSQKIEINNSKPKTEDNSEGKENNVNQPIIVPNDPIEDTQIEDKTDVKEEKMEVEESNRKSDKEQSNKKRKKAHKNDNVPSKKRKRIQVINDSDSSDIFSEADEDVVEKTDDEPEPPPPPKLQLQSKNKIRKAVDKTYVDEEGFIITKTEYVFESASEDEKVAVPVKDEPNPKTLQKKNSTTDSENDTKTAKGKKNKKPVSGKQQTLMNFFKKI